MLPAASAAALAGLFLPCGLSASGLVLLEDADPYLPVLDTLGVFPEREFAFGWICRKIFFIRTRWRLGRAITEIVGGIGRRVGRHAAPLLHRRARRRFQRGTALMPGSVTM